jgi:hypothetical protein
MTEEENMGVEETQEATAQAAESVEHDDVSQEAQESEQSQRNDAEYNWAEMRRKMREKDQQIEELRNQFSQISRREPTQEEKDELEQLAEDDILTVAQAKKLAQKMARKTAEEVIKQREAATVEERVQLKFNDYNEVVSQKNIDYLKTTEPELARSLASMSDPYEQAVAAYKLLKRVGIKPEEKNTLEKKKVVKNSGKPLSVNAVTKQSAIGNAHLFENGLTKELKQQLHKEMQDAIKAG